MKSIAPRLALAVVLLHASPSLALRIAPPQPMPVPVTPMPSPNPVPVEVIVVPPGGDQGPMPSPQPQPVMIEPIVVQPAITQAPVRQPPIARPMEPPPCPSVGEEYIPRESAERYRERSNTLFLVGSIGYGSVSGTLPVVIPGVTLGASLRIVRSGWLVEPSFDVVFDGQRLGSSAPYLEIRPAVRGGYTGAITQHIALGIRLGYAMDLAISRFNPPGLIHQVELSPHLTIVTDRGVILEPFLAAGVQIANPITPIAVLGLRVGTML
ncbi:MAG: hypothetical protein Q8Q09_27405 [Deltaproteobacteria bacterium]|nr:hypothetical protein [Deltaproteobacteria bacterium]